MPVYRKCTECGKKVLEGTLCKCEIEKRKESYRDYKHRRLQDKEEKERQKFYSGSSWLRLSENVKKHYFGLCVMCWFKDQIQESKYTHHIETMKDRFDMRLNEDNLIALCSHHHTITHTEYDKSDKNKKIMQKALKELIKKFNEEYYE